MISVSNLTVSFGGKSLFEDISFLINPKDRIGLVGKNGAGKSTILKILSGNQIPSAGVVSKNSSATIGYLPQEMKVDNDCTVMEETRKAFSQANELEALLDKITEEVSTRTDYESDAYMQLLDDMHEANERFALIGGFKQDGAVEKVLCGLGFKSSDLNRGTSEFSGGWRMRIELAKILLQQPTLLILDEPTNHLDIDAIEWLEEFLKGYYGSIILVSHDRDFLDAVTNRTIEITSGRIYDFKANYTKYMNLREERLEQQSNEKKNQDKYIEHTQELINKFRAKKNKAAFAQSLIKKLDKLEAVEMDETENAQIHFRFAPAPRSGKVVVKAEGVGKSYGEKNIFHDVDMEIERNDFVALVGQNGQGKSTMSKIVAGLLDYTGELTIGHNVSIGYYAQNQSETLDGEKTVLETIDDVATGDMRKNIRNLLGSFLFGGDAVDKKVKVLSGGEKARLALCKLLLQPYNLLVLDEPTNHLDMRSKDMLKNAVKKFDGTLIVVSHDRNFMQGLTNKVFEFKDGVVKPHIGDIYSFLEQRKITNLAELDKQKPEEKSLRNTDPKELKLKAEPVSNFQDKEKKKAQQAIVKIEQQIADAEKKLHEMDALLVNEETFAKHNNPAFFKEYDAVKHGIDDLMKQWEALQL
jgi:ATP-binding cassette subfamily F protein 3